MLCAIEAGSKSIGYGSRHSGGIIAVLEAEAQVFQVGINVDDARTLLREAAAVRKELAVARDKWRADVRHQYGWSCRCPRASYD